MVLLCIKHKAAINWNVRNTSISHFYLFYTLMFTRKQYHVKGWLMLIQLTCEVWIRFNDKRRHLYDGKLLFYSLDSNLKLIFSKKIIIEYNENINFYKSFTKYFLTNTVPISEIFKVYAEINICFNWVLLCFFNSLHSIKSYSSKWKY